MSAESVDLYISVNAGPDIDKEDLEKIARELMGELNELEGVQSVKPVSISEIPAGAKGPAIDWGTLVLTVAQTSAISALVSILGAWLSRDKSRTLELTIADKTLKLTGLSRNEQQKWAEWFQTQAGFKLDR